MNISNKGIELIKQFEGCRLTAYQDVVGVWTIGYGTTNADRSITGTEIKSGLQISQQTADEWLRRSLNKKYHNKVMKYDSTYRWNQNQYDALISFAYNIGSIDQLTANGTRSIDKISEKILSYHYAGGKSYSGLKRRREAEKALFDAPVKIKPGWNRDHNGWWYMFDDGSYPTCCWKLIDHYWYYFNDDGYIMLGWQQIEGEWYYLDTTDDENMGRCWHEKPGGKGAMELWYVE